MFSIKYFCYFRGDIYLALTAIFQFHGLYVSTYAYQSMMFSKFQRTKTTKYPSKTVPKNIYLIHSYHMPIKSSQKNRMINSRKVKLRNSQHGPKSPSQEEENFILFFSILKCISIVQLKLSLNTSGLKTLKVSVVFAASVVIRVEHMNNSS